jgi:hypothetical protein
MGVTKCLCRGSQAASLLCSSLGRSLFSFSSMQFSTPPSILFVGRNRRIGMEGWAAVGRALPSKRNLRKLDLGELYSFIAITIAVYRAD